MPPIPMTPAALGPELNGLSGFDPLAALAGETQPEPMEPELVEPAKSDVRREVGDVPEERRNLVKRMTAEILADKKKHAKAFKKMREDQDFAFGRQWEPAIGSEDDPDEYVANITLRHVTAGVAALYAKNPRIVAKSRRKLDFVMWDEKPETIQIAMTLAQAGDANAALLLKDVLQGLTAKQQRKRVGETLQILWEHIIDSQVPPFKQAQKHVVRTTKTCGVGYSKLCFRRELGTRPETASEIDLLEQRIATCERINADIIDNEAEAAAGSAELERLRLTLKDLQAQPEVVTAEGFFFDYPASTSIIPGSDCKNLLGWTGASRVSQEYILSRETIIEIWKVDPGTDAQRYELNGPLAIHASVKKDECADTDLFCVWERYNRKDGLVYFILEGYPDFLREPAAPEVQLERFYPWFPLVFNAVEHEGEIFPPSDVRLVMPMQKEHNRSREALRQHRWANRPGHVAGAGVFGEDEQDALSKREAHAVVNLKRAIDQNQKISDLMQEIPKVAIDPNLYDTSPVFDDFQRTGGSQEANLGGTSGATATESSIAESSRMGTVASNVDDLDEYLTEIAREGGQIAMMEMSGDMVREIVGPGAVWPEQSMAEIRKELFLSVRAGSSGRPNRTVELQNLERMLPLMLRIPEIKPSWLLDLVVERLDDGLDVTEAMASGMPSVDAINSMMAKMNAGGAAPTPGQQPGEQGGGDNAPAPAEATPAPMPGDPAPPDPAASGIMQPTG